MAATPTPPSGLTSPPARVNPPPHPINNFYVLDCPSASNMQSVMASLRLRMPASENALYYAHGSSLFFYHRRLSRIAHSIRTISDPRLLVPKKEGSMTTRSLGP